MSPALTPALTLNDAIPVLNWPTQEEVMPAVRSVVVRVQAINGRSMSFAIVGLPATNDARGIVKVFGRPQADRYSNGSPTVWREVQTLSLGGQAHAGDQFGYSVAVTATGETLAIGVPGDDALGTAGGAGLGGTDSGAVRIYRLNPAFNADNPNATDMWVEDATLKAPNAGPGDGFGRSVGFWYSGGLTIDYLVAGAPFEDSCAQGDNRIDGDRMDFSPTSPLLGDNATDCEDAGAVYIFSSPSRSGAWTRRDYVKPTQVSPVKYAYFGDTLAMSQNGRAMAVGAPGASWGGFAYAGAVQVWRNILFDGYWSLEANLVSRQASALVSHQRFGAAVALSPDGLTLAVGDPGAHQGLTDQSGLVEVHARGSNGAWALQQSLREPLPLTRSNRFGSSVALGGGAGEHLIVGVPEHDGPLGGVRRDDWVMKTEANYQSGASASGAAYRYLRNGAAQWDLRSRLKSPEPSVNEFMGSAVSIDPNGNLTGVIGRGRSGAAGQNRGALYLY